MKKSGFTLAEVLVTLGIIGVVAALVMPAAQKLIPDKTKTQYLKTYDTISTMVNALASNSKLYPVCNQASDASCTEHPLISLGLPIDNRFNNARYSGDRKLCSLMAYNFGVPEADINCSATPYTFNAADYTNNFANPSFTTQNGMRWRIVPQIATSITPANWTARYQTDIYVDINPSNNNVNGSDQSCIYDADSCTNPDIFKFQVAANGKVAAADQMGLDYIKNRTSLTKKTAEIEDVEIADNMIGRGFLYKDCSGNGGECPEGQHWDDETEACVAGDDGSDVTLTFAVERIRESGYNRYPAVLTLSKAIDTEVSLTIKGSTPGGYGYTWVNVPAGATNGSNNDILAGSPVEYSVSIGGRTFSCAVSNFVCTSGQVVSEGEPKYTLVTTFDGHWD